MPGVLIIEGMAQTAGLLLLNQQDDQKINSIIAGIDKQDLKKGKPE